MFSLFPVENSNRYKLCYEEKCPHQVYAFEMMCWFNISEREKPRGKVAIVDSTKSTSQGCYQKELLNLQLKDQLDKINMAMIRPMFLKVKRAYVVLKACRETILNQIKRRPPKPQVGFGGLGDLITTAWL